MAVVFYIIIFGLMLTFITFINQILYDIIDLIYWSVMFFINIIVIIIAKKMLDELMLKNKYRKQIIR